MPRHRKESGPRHGKLRRDTSPRRSVVPRGPVFGPAFGLDAGLGLRPAVRRSRLRLARSLLATPWFAAGAGIMIAAVLAVDSPTALTYGPTFPGPRCPVHRCGSAGGHLRGPTPGIALKAPGMERLGERRVGEECRSRWSPDH